MAKAAKDFCSCTDLKCPLHPTNHDQGCDLCIKKNLQQLEIPSCFFNKATDDPTAVKRGTTFDHFVSVVLAEKKKAEDKP